MFAQQTRTARRSVLRLLGAACLSACADAPADIILPDPYDQDEITLQIISGDRQEGVDGELLERPLIVEVRDRTGRVVPDVQLTWHVNDGGVVTPLSPRTNAEGRAEARWQLGTMNEHEGTVRTGRNVSAAFSAALPIGADAEVETRLLQPRTYEKSRQTVHPDFVRTPPEWGGYQMRLAMTPYPNGLTQYENPSVFVTRSGFRWFPEPGIINPVVSPDVGYLSDPDVLYVPERRELWLYYRKADDRNRILVTRSSDGISWTEPIPVLDGPNHTIISPSIVHPRPGEFYMWYVNGGSGGCNAETATMEMRFSRNGLRWSRARTVRLGDGSQMPWHVEVQWIPSREEYWAIYPAKTAFNCATTSLYMATSKDGIDWTTFPSPVLRAGDLEHLHDIVYRSTFEYHEANDDIHFWFSGANYETKGVNWRTVFQRRPRTDVMTTIAQPFVARPNMSRSMLRFAPP